MSKLRSGAVLNMAAQIFEQGLQFLAPILLLRLVAADQFADYRIFWLIVSTCMLLAPLGLPHSLQHFIPRLDRNGRAALMGHTFLLLAVAGMATALAVSLATPLLPENVRLFFFEYSLSTLVFLTLWVTGAPADTIANAHQDYVGQFALISSLAALRTGVILGLAFVFRDIGPVLIGLIGFAAVKLGAAVAYTLVRDGGRLLGGSMHGLRELLTYSIPFGLAAGLYSLRKYGEQWIVVALFSAQSFVAFSFAHTLVLPVMLVQSAIASTMLARLNDLHQQRQYGKLLELNRKANVASGFVSFPIIVFLFAFAPEIIEMLFTSAYLDAVPVVRIYLIQILLGVDVGSLCNAYGMGRFMLRFSSGLLVISLPLSYFGGLYFGLTGTAYGSLIASLLGVFVQYTVVARVVGVSLSELQHWRTLFSTLVLAIAAAGPSVLLTRMSGLENLYTFLALAAAIYGVIYLLAFILTGRHRMLVS